MKKRRINREMRQGKSKSEGGESRWDGEEDEKPFEGESGEASGASLILPTYGGNGTRPRRLGDSPATWKS